MTEHKAPVPGSMGTQPEGIGDDVTLTVGTPHGPVLDLPLIHAAILARGRDGEILPFIYRDPYDPEEPDKPRPHRLARLGMLTDQVLDGARPPGPVTMTVRIVGGDPARVVQELRAAGQRLEFGLLGHADTAWSIRHE